MVPIVFLAAAEVGEAMLSPEVHGFVHIVGHFLFRTAVHLVLSVAHAGLLVVLCFLALRLPRLLRGFALLAVGAFAFAAEPLLHVLMHGSTVNP